MADYLFHQQQRQTYQAAWAFLFPSKVPDAPLEPPPAGAISYFPERYNPKSRGTWRGGGAIPTVAAEAPPASGVLSLPFPTIQRPQSPLPVWSPDIFGSESILGRSLFPERITQPSRPPSDLPNWSPDIFGSIPASVAGLFPEAYIRQRIQDLGFALPGAVDLIQPVGAEALPPGTIAIFPERFNAKSRGTWRGGGSIPAPPPGPSLEGTIWLWSFPDPAPKRAASEAYWIRPHYQIPEIPAGESILASIRWFIVSRTAHDVRSAFGPIPPIPPETPLAEDARLTPDRAPGRPRSAVSSYILLPFSAVVPDFDIQLPEEMQRFMAVIPRPYARASATAYVFPWHFFGVDAPGVPLGPAPAGTVPVRYLVGEIPNVVPVETVLTNEAGVVPVREEVGPANVVPVRETSTEVPRVKVRKV